MSFIKKLFSGLYKKNIGKNKRAEREILSELKNDEIDGKQVNYDTKQNRLQVIKENCEQIVENSKKLEEMKIEYQAVTSYLADMQRIDLIPKEEREELNTVAKKIITLTRERANYQSKPRRITDNQYKNIAKYEDEMPSELRKMKNNETYNSTIKKDMHYLEGEKGLLSYQKEEAIQTQSYLRKIAVTTCALIAILFILFAIVQNVYEADIKIPFLLTIVLALVSAIYIYTKSGSNRSNLKHTELKLNKAITLLNKVKIKYINSTSELDYTYQKYMVNSYAELNYLWEQYIRVKEEEKHYEKNTQELDYYNDKLVKELKTYSLTDPDIWVYQVIAIVDNKEMVEVRHRLNNRRQKLRERIDYNNSLIERNTNDIIKFINKRPEWKAEVLAILENYRIQLD